MNDNVLFATEDQLSEMDATQAETVVDSTKFLIFITENLKFGVEADSVVEIITSYSITYLPRLPDFIRGIINLRGLLIPIIDVRLRLGKPPVDDNALVIVLNVRGTQIGILVDSVDQMVDVPTDDLLPMPPHSIQRLVSGMCSLPNDLGTMMILDCEQLMPHE